MSFYQAKQYIKYKLTARNEHAVHGPFLFNLLTTAFYKPQITPRLKELDAWYNLLLASDTPFEHTDFGAGSKSKKGKTRKVGEYTQKVSKSRKYRHLLFQLSKHLEPNLILELGTASGVSGAYLHEGYPKSELHSLEGCNELSAIAYDEWYKLGIRNAKVKAGSFEETLTETLKGIQNIDLIYLDGNHKKAPTIQYFEQVLPKCSEKACILVDDIYWSKEMNEAWEEIKKHPRVTQTVDIFQIGIVFLNPDLSKENFIIRY